MTRVKRFAFALILIVAAMASSAFAVPYLEIFGGDGENKVFHFFIDESASETSTMDITFWPNEGNVTQAELFSNLNRRDLATLTPPDANTVVAGDTSVYWGAHTLTANGSGGYSITMPITKCGSYDITARYKVSGDSNWRWYGGRNAAVVVSDVETRDMIIMEMQAHVIDATGDTFATRSTFPDLHDGNRFDVNYLADLGVNCIWLQPFHPIGSKSDCNSGDPGSPYSIKNLFEVAAYLGSDNTRATAMTEFQAFVNAADAAGVKIISDVIFNHVSTDIEIARDPSNPSVPAASPLAEMRNVRPQWFSRYLGGSVSGCPTDKNNLNHGNFLWGEPATNAGEIGPAPADRHDFMWPDAYDLFWGTYSALGDINNTDDGFWNTSTDVIEMANYYAYFIEHWLAQTGNKMGGFRCDFAQGIPRRAWQFLINKAKSIKPELYFVAESLDGGDIAYRAWKGGFDALNENQLWAIIQNNNIQTTDLRGVFDSRKTQYGFALILRGTINHDQGPWVGRKWDAMAMHGVFCAIDGSPQMYGGQELGYDQSSGQYSKTRTEFGREIADIRNWHSIEPLWNDTDWDKDHLWNRYSDANKGRQRANVLRLANQYYIDQLGGSGPHQKIFSVLKYENNGWDAADQEVVLACINLDPMNAQAGTFDVDVPAVYLDPTKNYNVRNLASTTPTTKLWATPRSGSDIAANGIYVGFSGNVADEGSVTQYLLIEEDGGGTGGSNVTWVGSTSHFPANGDLDAGEDLWIDTQSTPIGAANFGTINYSTDGGTTWQSKPLSPNGTAGVNDKWNAMLGQFAAGQEILYSIEIVDDAGDTHVDNNAGVNYTATVNTGGGSGDPVIWVGATTHWPLQGEIDAGEDFWIDTQSWPQDTAFGGDVVYSIDGGATWQIAALTPNGTNGNNDVWHVLLGNFAAGTTIEFALNAQDTVGNTVWDNNGGSNYLATVNGNSGNAAIEWVGNTDHAAAAPPVLSGIFDGVDMTIEMENLKSGAGYMVQKSTNLMDSMDWTPIGNFTGNGNIGDYLDLNPTEDRAYYTVYGYQWPMGGNVFEGDDLILQIETYPAGAATNVVVIYTTTGVNWLTATMTKTGSAEGMISGKST